MLCNFRGRLPRHALIPASCTVARNWRKDGVATPPSLTDFWDHVCSFCSGIVYLIQVNLTTSPFNSPSEEAYEAPNVQVAGMPPMLLIEVSEGRTAKVAEVRAAPVEGNLPARGCGYVL